MVSRDLWRRNARTLRTLAGIAIGVAIVVVLLFVPGLQAVLASI